jgi:hypothetical protein
VTPRRAPVTRDLSDAGVEPVPDVDRGDRQDQRGESLLVVVAGRFGPDRVGDGILPIGEARGGFGQRERGVLRADPVAVEVAAARAAQVAPSLPPAAYGVDAVARGFSGRAQDARPALVDGLPGAVWAPGGVVRAAFSFAFVAGRIAGIEIVMDAAHLRERVEYDAAP